MARLLTLLLAAAAAAALTVPAGAKQAAPTPDCGVAITDKAGDNTNATTGQQGTPNTDVTQVFFRYGAKDGKPSATLNIRVAELDKTVQQPYTAHWYIVEFTANKEPKLVAAVIDAAGQTGFYYGHPREVTDTDPAPSYEGDTTGTLHEGKDGVIEIDMPIEEMKIAGATLGAPLIEVRQAVGRTATTIPAPIVFVAPIVDEGAGKGGFVVAPCAQPGVETPAAPLPAAPAAPLKVTVPKLSAKRLKKGRSIRITLEGTASGLKARLSRGSTVVATGKLASLSGKGTLVLKLTRAVRKGTYRLTLTDAAGKKSAVAVRVR